MITRSPSADLSIIPHNQTSTINKLSANHLTDDSRLLIGQNQYQGTKNDKKLSSYVISRASRFVIFASNKLLSLFLYITQRGKNTDNQVLPPLSLEKKGNITRMLDQLSADIKNNIQKRTTENIRNDVLQTFINLGLMNHEKQWTTPGLESISGKLADKMIIGNIEDMVDSMVCNIKDNECLMQAVSAMLDIAEDSDNTPELIKSNLQASLPFMLALNLLTEEQTKNSSLLEQCVHLWQDKRRQMGGALKGFGLKKTIKLISVEKPLLKIIAGKKKPEFPSSLGRCILPFNIIEATVVDLANSNHSNACAGLTLAKNYPGKYHRHAAELDRNGEILFHYPLPKEWDDLYTSWNMEFCADSHHWPLFFSKLLIPSVSGYKAQPKEYISHRANALYTTLNYVLLSKDLKKSKQAFTPAMRKAWSTVNKQYADLYQQKVHLIHRRKTGACAGWLIKSEGLQQT